MNKSAVFGTAAIAVFCVVLFAPSGCGKDDPPPRPKTAATASSESRSATTPPKPPPPAVDLAPLIVLTGNEKGFIRPCGCSKPKLGGIDRRATALERLRTKHKNVAVVGAGEMLDSGGRQQELKFEAFLMAMSAMNYAAFVPGSGDFRIGARALSERRGMASFPFVLANASIADEEPFVAQIPLGDTGGVLIGLVENMPASTGVTVTSAADALARELKAAGDAAFVLVVFNGPAEQLEAAAAVVPESLRTKTLFATPGSADTPMMMPTKAHGMPVIAAGAKGRALGLIRPGAASPIEAVTLEEALPAESTAASILDGYRTAVRDENLVRTLIRPQPAPGEYAGDASCVTCHAQTHDELRESRHQRAFATLVASRDDRDPECVKCHVTGWGLVGGYLDAEETPDRKDVDCEQCHGPSLDHVKKMTKTPGGSVTKETCLHCHDPDNSPQFKFDVYWPKIAHR